ncbi:hypothetical protein EC973_002540 [Apophysomyces ossiformis]|uniref:Uncharacterized protein n=1 Tax=Apophysomyces ossiformis TaxID=679940 RepID=A0A8H7C035_9FUNG|nr:hypothetical protein EC973_002540 [Apophysomyces ossiformis]
MKLWSYLLLVLAVILSIALADIVPATFNITKYTNTIRPAFYAKIYLPNQVIGLKIWGEFNYLTPNSRGHIKTPGPYNVKGAYSVAFTDDAQKLTIVFEGLQGQKADFEFRGESIGSHKVKRLEGTALVAKKRPNMYQQFF